MCGTASRLHGHAATTAFRGIDHPSSSKGRQMDLSLRLPMMRGQIAPQC